MPAGCRLEIATTECVDTNIVVVTLVKKIIDAGVGAEQPIASIDIDAEAKVADEITRYIHGIRIVSIQFARVNPLEHPGKTGVSHISEPEIAEMFR